MRVAILQHADHEGPGHLASWCAQRGASSRVYRPDQGELPARDTFEVLAVLGGPQAVYDRRRDPWLDAEVAFLETALAAERPVLGICLGSQLLAAALGARVARHTTAEIGWFEVTRTPESAASAFADLVPERLTTLHWHGDAYELPVGATRLFSSVACIEQGFSIGHRVLALQFHPEMTADMLPVWIEREPPPVGRWCQDGPTILAGRRHASANHQLLDTLLDRLIA